MEKFRKSVLGITAAICVVPATVLAASFGGNARIEIDDPSGGLSWVASNNAITVECWFRISIPSGQSISQNMTILVDRKTGAESDPYAYLIRYNINNGNIEYVTRGTSGAYTNNLIERPYLDRWYHVAVVRSGASIKGFTDGRLVFTDGLSVGNSVSNNNGVSVGGWSNGKYFYGEIQEIRIHQQAVNDSVILSKIFEDLNPATWPNLKGYYKLAYSTNSADSYRNFALNPPTNTNPGVKQGADNIAFDEVNQEGEQSLFDSRKNKGEQAITPLSGAFTWEQTILSRPTPGIAFELRIGYSSANAFSGGKVGEFDPFADSPLGKGWRHSFETRIIPEQISSERRILMWNGSVETWVKTGTVYQTRHKEYRGELAKLANDDFEWVTPDRIAYRFKDPTTGDAMAGRLYEIADYNSNVVGILYGDFSGVMLITQVVDTAGGRWDFNNNPLWNKLTNVTFTGWSVGFEYNGSNWLSARTLTGPPDYTNVNMRWEFYYTNGLLNRIKDPRNNNAARISYDNYGRKTSVQDALNWTTQTEYDKPARRQIRHTDPDGFQWIETYDRKGRLLSQQDPLGNTTSFTYDERGNHVSVTEPLGWKTYFGYDDRANVIAKTNALGEVWTWSYHPYFNKPLQETDPRGWYTYYAYDSAGNLLTNWDGLGILSQHTYYNNGLAKTSADGNSHTNSFTYTSSGFLASRTDPASNTWTFGYNELAWPLAVTNPLSQVTSYTYDLNGKVVQVVDPLWRAFRKQYDDNGNLTADFDAKNQVTRFYYNTLNQMTQKMDRAGASWYYGYTKLGKLETVKDPLGQIVGNAYDNANRLISITDPLSNSVSYAYDANGNMTCTTDKLGRAWAKTYDRLNRVSAETDPLGDTKQTTYDAVGRLKVVKTPMGWPSTHYYDGRGRLTNWVDAEGFTWHYDYDQALNITNITDALGGHYIMTYGPRNERLMERNQDNFTWQYVYDELLRPKQQTDPNGAVRAVVYDDGGRIDYVSYVSFSTGRTDDYSHDDNDNLENVTRVGSGPLTGFDLTYDSMYRVLTCRDQFSKTVTYTYDARSLVSSLKYPDNKIVTNRYDAIGRLTNQVDWAGRSMAYTYDKADRLVTRTYPNGITQTNAYDDAGRISYLKYQISYSNALIALEYAYDRNGNKTFGTEKGTLDWTPPSPIDETARYTPANRLMAKTDALSSNDWTYVYDPSGNMTNAVGNGQSYAFRYDEDNRVMSLFWDTGITTKSITNRYDGLGRRIAKTVDGVESRYVLDLAGKMERILCDVNSSGQIIAWYVHGPDLCYRVDQTNGLFCYHADAQANIIAITDASANTLAQYAYTPYGRNLGSSSTINPQPFLFVGSLGVMEELPNLYFMRARYYSAEAGVFLSTDPVKHIGPGWKPAAYLYGTDNPLLSIDPAGLAYITVPIVTVGRYSVLSVTWGTGVDDRTGANTESGGSTFGSVIIPEGVSGPGFNVMTTKAARDVHDPLWAEAGYDLEKLRAANRAYYDAIVADHLDDPIASRIIGAIEQSALEIPAVLRSWGGQQNETWGLKDINLMERLQTLDAIETKSNDGGGNGKQSKASKDTVEKAYPKAEETNAKTVALKNGDNVPKETKKESWGSKTWTSVKNWFSRLFKKK